MPPRNRLLSGLILGALACSPLDDSPGQAAVVVISLPAGTTARLAALGTTLQLSAVVADANGKPLPATGVLWSSSDTRVASVDQAGLVTALANGSATLTGQSGTARGSVGLTVEQAPQTVAVTPAEATVERGAAVSFSAAATDARGQAIPGAAFSWTSSAPAVATVDAAGTASGVGAGATTVTASFAGLIGSASLHVTVPGVAAVVIEEAAPAALTRLGATAQLHARAVDARSQPLPEAPIAWQSDAPAVATVTQDGLVTAVGDGQAHVTASAGGKSSSLPIAVAQAVGRVAVSARAGAATALASLGATVQLDAQAFDPGGAAVPGVSFAWAACDGAAVAPGCASTAVSVDGAGKVTALANGAALVQASGGGQSAALAVAVAQRVDAVSVTPAFDTIAPGKTRQFNASARDAGGSPVTPAPLVTWTSSRPAVASIDPSGLATAAAGLTAADSTTVHAAVTDAGGAHGADAALTVDPAIALVDHVVVTAGGSTSLARLGATVTVTASARDASDNPVPNVGFAWSSSAGSVASVVPAAAGSAGAAVHALGNGTAVIRADAGGQSGTVTVTVAQQAASLAAAGGGGLTLSSFGQTLQLVATDGGGASVAGGLTWTACDGAAAPPCPAATVALVSTSGLVTALKNGSARITAAAGGAAAGLDVAVAQQVASVSAGAASTTLTGAGQTLQLHALDALGHDVQGAGVTWSSTAPAAATVDGGGLVTAVDDGSTTVMARTAADAGKTVGITVDRRVASVETATPGASTTLASLGDTLQLRARDAAGALFAASLTWESGSAAATVDGSGLVAAAANGSATVRARKGAADPGSALDVLVSQRVASVTPAAPATLTSLGDAVQLSASDANGNAVAGSTWAACKDAATPAPPSACASGWMAVDASGKATAQANGSGRVYATRGGATAFATATVAQEIASVSVTPSNASVAVNASVAFGATARDANGNAVAGAPAAGWQGSNDTIATIDPNTGVATGRAEGGPITITATTGRKNGTAQLTVSGAGY